MSVVISIQGKKLYLVCTVCTSDGLTEAYHTLKLADSDSIRVTTNACRIVLSQDTIFLDEHISSLWSQLAAASATRWITPDITYLGIEGPRVSDIALECFRTEFRIDRHVSLLVHVDDVLCYV